MKKILTWHYSRPRCLAHARKKAKWQGQTSHRLTELRSSLRTVKQLLPPFSCRKLGTMEKIVPAVFCTMGIWFILTAWEKDAIVPLPHLSIFIRLAQPSPPRPRTLLGWPRRISSLCRAVPWITRMRKGTTSSWTFQHSFSFATPQHCSSRSRGCSSATRRRTAIIKNKCGFNSDVLKTLLVPVRIKTIHYHT